MDNKETIKTEKDGENVKENKAYLTRPTNWPRINMGYVKSKVGMLNDREFKLVILACKTGDEAIATINTLRSVNDKAFTELTPELNNNKENFYVIIRKLTLALNETIDRLAKAKPAVIVDCAPSLKVADKEGIHEALPKEPEPVKDECPADDGETGMDEEEPIEDDAEESNEEDDEDYSKYDEMIEENARKNAAPKVAKSERFK